MAYFNYHAKLKTMIESGKLTSYYFTDNYKNIGFALVLCFSAKKYPIREPMFEQYFELIGKNYLITKSGDVYLTSVLKLI